MSDLRSMSRRQLEDYATAFLRQREERPRMSVVRSVEDVAPCTWTLSPVSAPDGDDEDDASEIAREFAEYSGGHAATAWHAHGVVAHEAIKETKRRNMQELRTFQPQRAQAAREREYWRRNYRKVLELPAAVTKTEAERVRRRDAYVVRRRKVDERQLAFEW